jgi:TonB family protein
MTAALLPTLLKTTTVLAVTLALVAAARRRSAAVRHWVLVVGLTSTLLLPIVSGIWPASLAAPLTTSAVTTRPLTPATQFDLPPDAVRGHVTTTVTTIADAGPIQQPTPWSGAGSRYVAMAWALGAALAALRVSWGLLTLRRFMRRATPVTDGPWRASCDAAARRMGLARPVRLLQSAHATPLVTWGWHRPTILLPADAVEWPADRRHIVLAHELAHIARGDWAAQLTAEAVRALHWYHPLAWAANRRLRVEGEHAADDCVVADGVNGTDYASHLLALAQQARGRVPWTPAPAVARPSSLEGRIRAMLDPSIDRTPLTRRSQATVAVLALAGLLPLAALTTAQTQFHTLHGTIVDPSGRVLPNVTIGLVNETTSAKHEVRTDASGRYEFVGLPAATYSLSATTLGFQPRTESVSIAGDRELPLRLAVGTLQETITVTSAPSAPVDPVAEERRRVRNQERDTRAAERQAKAAASCAAGPATAVGGNILPPWKIRHVSPAYPEQARAAGLGGTVTMRAVIDTTGAVSDVRDVKGPSPELEAAAVEAVREWRFTPTLLNCEAIAVEMDARFDFSAQK